VKETTAYVSTATEWEATQTVEEFDGPDGTGNLTKGDRRTVKSKGPNRVTTTARWDPATRAWQRMEERAEQLQPSKASTVYLLDSASAGGLVIGTVETEVQAVAGGVVVARASNGHEERVGVDPNGQFVIPSSLLVPGVLSLTIKDQVGTILAGRSVQVAPGLRPDPTSPPAVAQVPSVLPAGAVGRLTGHNLCHPESLAGPRVMLNASGASQPVRVLAASDREIRVRVPSAVVPGAASLVVDSGTGQLSAPALTNPVKISVTTPSRITIGERFNAAIAVEGLTAENRGRPLIATVVVSGGATFPRNQREIRVPIKDGIAQVPMIAQGAGTYEVRVTEITSP